MRLLLQGARFRDTSQQIHKQWQADPARAFPTVGSVAANSPSPGSGELSTPNSTPSPSPSPTNQQVTPVRRGTFDAAEGLMLRFSPGFYVGSMKNVPLALLAGNTITTTIATTTTIIILAPALALRAFRRCETCFKATTFAAREQL
ncbi:hypothetical protein X777_04865 [Ooceraea biroi]|uniref:Uncharacterized protein n=1 Tax=Ooceraea biroi TaxID=2015173 RepID=A0A026WI11_OOCBI|nr:hypothetical protein X777_04865 [Ooceraea biroi]